MVSRAATPPTLDRLDSRTIEDPKVKKFRKILERENGPDLESLKQLAWSGIPQPFRPLVWRLLLGSVFGSRNVSYCKLVILT
jgi:hypothetical protein